MDYAEPVQNPDRHPWSPEPRADGPPTRPWARAGPGTYFYMAPEMIRHEAYDQRADVYSWGVLLAEVLTQRPPYEGLYLTPVQVCLKTFQLFCLQHFFFLSCLKLTKLCVRHCYVG